MNKGQIEKRRMASASQRGKAQPDGVWRDWYEEMARKTVIRALCNKLPMSAEDVRRMMIEDEANETRLKDVTPQEEAPRRNLAQQLREPEAEILPPENSSTDWPEVDGIPLDLDEAFPGADEYDEGVKAFQAGAPWKSCPYMSDREKATNWCAGWFAAEAAGGSNG